MEEESREAAAPSEIHAVVVGLGREGTALTRCLVERGVQVTATDLRSAEALRGRLTSLDGLPVTYVLGGHPLDLLDDADIIFVSPGVPIEIPLLMEARKRRLPLSSETRLFSRLCPAPIVGITGSSGKTTTTALVGEMLMAGGLAAWVGGNIGRPLIGHLDEMSASNVVVMELSSFQLEFFAPWSDSPTYRQSRDWPAVLFDPTGWSPPVAAVLNITPNHLDRHDSMDAYISAKAHIMRYQRSQDVVVVNADNPVTRHLGRTASQHQQVLWFSLDGEVDRGAHLRGEELVLKLPDEEVVCRAEELRLLGRHNLSNALAACVLAGVVGTPITAMQQVLVSFGGVEHRLELVRTHDGVRWYNDSIATTPERALAALEAFPDDPIVLLAGGRDKHLPWDEMAAMVWKKARYLILFGEAAPLIERAMLASSESSVADCQVCQAQTLDGAVAMAAEVVRPGDVVLLSPGGTSFDAYADFAARGQHFKELVQALE